MFECIQTCPRPSHNLVVTMITTPSDGRSSMRAVVRVQSTFMALLENVPIYKMNHGIAL